MAKPKSKMMERKPPVEFTPERKARFLKEFRSCGLLYLAAERVGVSARNVQDHVKNDPAFGELYLAAKETHTDTMVKEAIRRAIDGVEVPIIGGKDRDTIVTTVREYSDKMLDLLLRSRRDEFRANGSTSDGGQQGGIVVIPSTPMSASQWEAEYGEKARGTTGAAPGTRR